MARTASPDKALEKFQQAVTDSESRFLSVAKAVNEIEGGHLANYLRKCRPSIGCDVGGFPWRLGNCRHLSTAL